MRISHVPIFPRRRPNLYGCDDDRDEDRDEERGCYLPPSCSLVFELMFRELSRHLPSPPILFFFL